MNNLLFPSPRTYSYNFACDVIEKLYNPNYKPLAEPVDSPVSCKTINASVTYFYVDGELIAVYDETSGLLWATRFNEAY